MPHRMRQEERCLVKRAALIVIVCFAIGVFPACRKESEEDKVRKVVQIVQKASEEKDVKKVLSSVSKTYRDPQGNDYNAIKALLLGYFFQHQRIHAYIPSIDVTVEGDSARALFQAVLTGAGAPGSKAPLMPDSLGMYTFEVQMAKEEGTWKVVSAKWERTGTGQPGTAP